MSWMLSRESKIISSVGPYNRRSLSPAERGWTFENIVTLELKCKDETFAEKSKYIWFILLFCPARTNNCVIIWSNVSLTFCDGVVLCRVFTSLIIVIFHQEHFYLLSKVLFRLLPLSSLLEFTVFSNFNLSLTFSILPIDLILQGQNNNLLKVQMLSILLLVNCFS